MTAIIILFEMTDNYRIILPLMLAVVLAQLVASRLDPESIYSIKLRRQGGLNRPRTATGTLDILLVADAMVDDTPSVSPDLPLADLVTKARHEDTRSWVVTDEADRLAGVVTVTDLERALLTGTLEGRTVREIMATAVVTCEPGETLREAFSRFAEGDVHLMPVLDPDSTREVVGVLRRTEMMWAFKELADEHVRLLSQHGLAPVHAAGGSVHADVQVELADDEVCFRAVRDIAVPPHTLIALLRRGERAVVPRGFTRVEPGDVLTVIGTRDHRAELEAWVAARRAWKPTDTSQRP